MALADEVQGRYGAQFLIGLTNPQLSTATSIDTTRLNYAVSDVQAAFKVHCGVAYDNTKDTHIMAAVEGVILRLKVLSGQESGDKWESYKKSLESGLALVEGRDRILPYTDSQLDPTEDTAGDLPKSDRNNFKGYSTQAPSQPTTQD